MIKMLSMYTHIWIYKIYLDEIRQFILVFILAITILRYTKNFSVILFKIVYFYIYYDLISYMR